jgi:hypothetical protein
MSPVTASRPADHDDHGRFAPGNAGGPGNPFGWRVARFRMHLLTKTTEQEFEEIRQAVVKAAKEGDMAAARLFFQYLLGKPLAGIDPDQLAANDEKRRNLVAAAESKRVCAEFKSMMQAMDRVAKLPPEVAERYLPLDEPAPTPTPNCVGADSPPSVNGRTKLSRRERKLQRERARELGRNPPSLNGNSPPLP